MERLRVRDLAGSINKCYSLQSKRLMETETQNDPEKTASDEKVASKPRVKTPRKRSIREVHRSEGYESEKDVKDHVPDESESDKMSSVIEVNGEPEPKRRISESKEGQGVESPAITPAVEVDTIKELMFQVNIILYC